MSSLTHKYIPRILQREENLFVEEYFSGTDTKIYIDGEEQKEISYIQYSVNEQLKPIYGYNSRVFDDVSVGNRIVMGVLKIPITNKQEQSSYEDVINNESKKTTKDMIDEYNMTEQTNKNNTEWILPEVNETPYNDNTIFEYQSKLKSLGYTVTDSGQLDEITKKAIKDFQDYAGIFVTGTFTTESKRAIDEIISVSNFEEKNLNHDAILYSGPAESFYQITTLLKNSKVFIIDDSFQDFLMVKSEDGKTGYIKKQLIG